MKAGAFAWVWIGFTVACLAQPGTSGNGRSLLDQGWRRDTRPIEYRPPPALSQLRLKQAEELQARTLTLWREARLNGDLDAALAAAWQANANLQLIAALTDQAARRSDSGPASSPIAPLALRDGTIRPVRAYWLADDVVNLVTMEGKIEQLPADQVNWKLTGQLNTR